MDILAISCDSFNEETNFTIGRHQSGKNHLTSLISVRNWCMQYKVAFKINTVVNIYNLEENMTDEILELKPVRWKVCINNCLRKTFEIYSVCTQLTDNASQDNMYMYYLIIQVFQCLLIDGENAGPEAKKNAESFVITDKQFSSFLQRHASVPQLVPESNDMMRNSYLILDEYVSCNNLSRPAHTPKGVMG